MLHYYHLHAVRKTCDSAIERKFVVIGRRAEEKPKKPTAKASAEKKEAYRMEASAHALAQSRGYYSDTIIDWCATREDAEAVVSAHQAPDWLDVRIDDVTGVIR